MEIRRLQFTLKQSIAFGNNVVLKFTKDKKPFDKILAVTDDQANLFTHVDYGMWVALRMLGETDVISIDVFDTEGPVDIEVIETSN